MSAQNVFAGAFVDRWGHRREDSEWLSEAMMSDKSCFIAVWGDKCLTSEEPFHAILLDRHAASAHLREQEVIFLGKFRDRPAFAFGIDGATETPFQEVGEFHDLRYLGHVLPVDEANLVAHARALVLWHRMQKYCGHCDPECRAVLFPRVDPAIIVLVSRGDRCLLGRQPSWPEGRYSTIAGFVEPGESLEDAIRREVAEEANVLVENVRYHSSQPWPFPSSLMLGFTAKALTEEILLNDGELEDAQWFSRKQLRSGFPKLPYRLSIARRLVDDWLLSDVDEISQAR
jgi:NAD+ diphosphatase